MATEVIKIIDPDNGSGTDYTSLSAWEAAQQGDLTGVRDEIAVAKCRCTGGTADTTAVTINGWTTDSTRYIKIWTDPTESYRHNGTWQTGNKYRLSVASDVSALYIQSSHVKIIGLQIERTGNSTWGNAIDDRGGYCTISHCLLRTTGTITNEGHAFQHISDNASYFYNNIILAAYGSGIIDYNNNVHILNNTVANCADGINAWWNTTCTNNLVCNCSGDNFTSYISGDTNASDDGTAPSGTGNRTNQTFSFVGGGDYHLTSSDTAALGYGTNLYNYAACPFQTDIDGQDRGGSGAQWDIGADEYVAAASAAYPYHIFNQ